MPESVTHVSGINCYPSIRKGMMHENRQTTEFLAGGKDSNSRQTKNKTSSTTQRSGVD